MHRRPLLEVLAAYRAQYPDEHRCIDRICALVEAHADCFERSCLPGHVTGSAWVVSPERDRFLLTHHRKLGRWLQLGGHADGDPDIAAVALREAREESGMQHFALAGLENPAAAARGLGRESTRGWAVLPVDVDVHRIPARKHEPAHEHHDIRFLLIAAAGQQIEMSHESLDLRWFACSALPSASDEESLLRLGRKAHALLASTELVVADA